MSVLLIDVGNTKLKWRFGERAGYQYGQCLLSALPSQWPDAHQVLVASVGAHGELQRILKARYGQALQWLDAPVLTYPDFHHCYDNPQRLGVDRWLAMLGARTQDKGNLLVADAGTAFTLDLLSQDNHHQGGFIVPGLTMAQQALFQQTAKVRPFSDEQEIDKLRPGQNTFACVRSGVLRQQLALLQSVQQDYPAHRLFLTGGDGLWLAQELGVVHYSNLIFDGMESLCVGYF